MNNVIPRDYEVGETVYYVLPRSQRNSRPDDLYLRGIVTNVTKKRVVVKLDSTIRSRVLARHHITRYPPKGALMDT